jgi:hypothetical protein
MRAAGEAIETAGEADRQATEEDTEHPAAEQECQRGEKAWDEHAG